MSKFFQFKSYIKYWLTAVNEHSLHGPFIYDIYKNVFKKSESNGQFDEIDKVRERLENSTHYVEVKDFGAGSKINNEPKREVCQIAKTGTTPKRYSELLYRLIDYTESKNILELGTSLGINTLYLSLNEGTHVTTVEGAESLANIAESVFEAQNRDNINVVCSTIDSFLPEFILRTSKLDFVYFDANHTFDATWHYFEECLKKSHDKTCFVFDDIHWSKSMEAVWNKIISDYRVTLSIDIYQMGIVFFNPEFIKQNYVLDFK